MGIRTFIPASQLSLRYVEKIDEFVGQDMTLKIIEVDKAKKRIVASRKAVLMAEEAEQQEGHLGKPGSGRASSRAPFAVWRTSARSWTSAAWTAWFM